MEQKFDFIKVTLDPKDYDKVKEVYRLHKEQSYKIFDLASGISTDEDIMDYEERRNAEEDWKAEASDALEDN